MHDELRKLLQQYPLIASKIPELGLLSENNRLRLQIQQSALYRKLWGQQRKKLAAFSTDSSLKKMVEPADRFRDITRAHVADTVSDIDWPASGISKHGNDSWDQKYQADCRAITKTPEQAKALFDLFQTICTQLTQALNQPSPAFEDRYSVRVEFLECIAWVALKIEQQIKMEVKDSSGNWQLSTFRFDLLKPMHQDSWIEQVLLTWVDELVLSFDEEAEDAYNWLRENLADKFHHDDFLRGIRQQITRHMSVNPGMIEACRLIKQQSGTSKTLMNTEVSEMWLDADFWAELYLKYPQLILLCNLAGNNTKTKPIRDVSEIRPTCLDHGLSPSGWRFLLREGEASYRAVIDSGLTGSNAFPVAIKFIEWQKQSGLKHSLPRELAVAFVNFAALTMFGGVNIFERVDPRIARVAAAEFEQLKTATERARFVEKDWLEILIWMRNVHPDIDKNQWKSGWSSIRRMFEDSLTKRDRNDEWPSRIGEMTMHGYNVVPITDSKELCLEGMRMRHCVSTYASRCQEGTYRVFSIRDAKSNKRVATAGVLLRANAWQLDQVKGRNNRKVNAEITSCSKSLAQFYQQADSRFNSRMDRLRDREKQAQQGTCETGLAQVSVSSENRLMSRKGVGAWKSAKASDYPISPELMSILERDDNENPNAVCKLTSGELAIRLRLELPSDYAVYIWDQKESRDRLLMLS